MSPKNCAISAPYQQNVTDANNFIKQPQQPPTTLVQRQQLHYQQQKQQTATSLQQQKYQHKQQDSGSLKTEVIHLDPPQPRLQQSPDSSGRATTSPGTLNASPEIPNTTSVAVRHQDTNDQITRNVNPSWRNSNSASSNIQKDVSSRSCADQLKSANSSESSDLPSNSSYAATLANLLKLNSCTITNASLSSQDESSSGSQLPSHNQLPNANKVSREEKCDKETSRARSSPQVPSINSTTNVPCNIDKKFSSAIKVPNCTTISQTQSRSKKESISFNTCSSQAETTTDKSKNVSESPSNVTISHNTRGSLKNSDIRRSIASALPHLSASMVAKEMSPLKLNSGDSSQHDRLFVDSVTDLGRNDSFSESSQIHEPASDLTCLANSISLRNADSPCLPFPSTDAIDLSVANDLLLLAHSDLQFPIQCNSTYAGCSNITVSSTSCAEKTPSPPIIETFSNEDSVASSSRNSAVPIDRSNSNSPNPRFGSRHLLCQIVPAHSQSKTATARAKPLTPMCQIKTSTVKSEVKDGSPDPAFSIITELDVVNKSTDADSSCSSLANQIDAPLSTVNDVSLRKRGRPPKLKESHIIDSRSSLNSDLTVRSETKNGRGIGELEIPRSNLVHQSKLKIAEEKVTSSKKLTASSKSDLKDSKMGFPKFDMKKSLQVKTESLPKIKSEKVSPGLNSPVDNSSNVSSSTNFNLINGHGSLNGLPFSDIVKLSSVLNCNELSNAKGQIPNCEEMKLVLTEHSRPDGNKVKHCSKRSNDDSKASKSDSSSSREGSNPPNRSSKSSKSAGKGRSFKNAKAYKKSSDSKSRCKKSLLAYLKEKNENDTSTVDSDVPSSSGVEAVAGSSSDATAVADQKKTCKPVVFSPAPVKILRRRQSSGSTKGKIVKKPKWIHGWSWEGEPYQGKVWLRVSGYICISITLT